ncbi:MAG TPA: acyl-CoA dehydrogenase family protein [Rugosimonospora sp.]|nr:acyl-CoA dehydrogenase family protein [Rugosimonospora sp.]
MGFALDQTADDDTFRAQVRAFVAERAPAGLADLADWSPLLWGNSQVWPFTEQMRTGAYREWERTLLAERLVCADWPYEYGGRGLSQSQCAILDEEFLAAGVPRITREQAEGWLGPVIMVHGSEEQKLRFLPRIVSGEDRYAHGFSEPESGSDLASLRTRGVVDGDVIRISGQKIWTTLAFNADWIYVLCRTDPDAVRHRGLTFVLVPVHDNAGRIDIRPIRQMTGQAEFCEIFFDGAVAPVANVIGGLHNGWRAAMTTLGAERAGRITAKHAVYAKEFFDVLAQARGRGWDFTATERQAVARAYTAIMVQKEWADQAVRHRAHATEAGPAASLEKLWTTESRRALGELAVALGGLGALVRPEGEGYPTDTRQHLFLHTRSGTIGSGTSEIQRNLLAERYLGLPKGPEAELLRRSTADPGRS